MAQAKTSSALTTIQEQIKAELKQVQQSIAPISNSRISLKGKVFTLPDGSTNPGPIQAVILDWRSVNAYYKGVYNPQQPEKPACFAQAKLLVDLKPAEGVKEPQADSCAECPMDKFGSAPNGGRGKACKNSRRLAIVPVDADIESDIWTIDVSPKGITGFDSYVNRIASAYGALPIQMVTTISFNAHEAYPMLLFSDPQPHDKLEVMAKLRETAQSILNKLPEF